MTETNTVAPVPDGFDDAKNAPPRYESPVSVADLAALRRQGKTELADTIATAQKSYAPLIAKGAKLVFTTSAGNNGRPVISVVPPSLAKNADASVKYDVQVHYHGQHGTAAKPAGDSQSLKQIEASFDRKPPTVYVLPTAPMVSAGGIATPQWQNAVRDTGKTATDAVAGVVGQRGTLTVSAHSFGRKALTEAINRGGLKADRVDVQDAFWPTQGADPKALRQWMTKNPDAKVRISTGMSTKDQIQSHVRADPFPSEVFWRSFRGGHHWEAELQPWPK